MPRQSILAPHLHANGILRRRLWDLERALEALQAGGYGECLQALARARRLCRLLQTHILRQAGSQTRLYSFIESEHPRLRPLVARLRRQQAGSAPALEAVVAALVRFNVTGDATALLRSGRKLIQLLLSRLALEEGEVFPLLSPEAPSFVTAPVADLERSRRACCPAPRTLPAAGRPAGAGPAAMCALPVSDTERP